MAWKNLREELEEEFAGFSQREDENDLAYAERFAELRSRNAAGIAEWRKTNPEKYKEALAKHAAYRRWLWANSPEHRKKMQESTNEWKRKNADNPEWRARKAATDKRYLDKKLAADPEYREKRNQYQRDLRTRRKAEKLAAQQVRNDSTPQVFVVPVANV